MATRTEPALEIARDPTQVLSTELLERCWQRAPVYDRENRFFTEDFEELRAAGYLLLPVPEEFGGFGARIDEVCRQQRRLAYYAAPTALALNMHLYWVGLCADLWRAGDRSLEWVLQEAARGAVFAAGHAESGNDVPVLASTAQAERVEGGYRFNGHKSFGSLSPVWTYLGLHAMDTTDPSGPKVVHAFMPRDSDGFTIRQTWDNVLGMRATRSDDTIIDNVFVPDRLIARVVKPGIAGMDLFVLGVFAWALLGFGNIYAGLGRRIFDMTIERVKKKKSIALSRSYMSYHAGIQHDIAEMWQALEAAEPMLDRVADEYARGVDHGGIWGAKIVSAKNCAVDACWRVADRALDVAGGFGIFPASGLERLIRDARIGRLHPANRYLTEEIVAKTALGIDLDEQPRWG